MLPTRTSPIQQLPVAHLIRGQSAHHPRHLQRSALPFCVLRIRASLIRASLICFVPLPDGLVGAPICGFPAVQYSVALRRDTPFDGARWLLDHILEQGSPDTPR